MNEQETAIERAREVVDAYVQRFKRDNAGRQLFGPIDEQIKELQKALRMLAPKDEDE